MSKSKLAIAAVAVVVIGGGVTAVKVSANAKAEEAVQAVITEYNLPITYEGVSACLLNGSVTLKGVQDDAGKLLADKLFVSNIKRAEGNKLPYEMALKADGVQYGYLGELAKGQGQNPEQIAMLDLHDAEPGLLSVSYELDKETGLVDLDFEASSPNMAYLGLELRAKDVPLFEKLDELMTNAGETGNFQTLIAPIKIVGAKYIFEDYGLVKRAPDNLAAQQEGVSGEIVRNYLIDSMNKQAEQMRQAGMGQSVIYHYTNLSARMYAGEIKGMKIELKPTMNTLSEHGGLPLMQMIVPSAEPAYEIKVEETKA